MPKSAGPPSSSIRARLASHRAAALLPSTNHPLARAIPFAAALALAFLAGHRIATPDTPVPSKVVFRDLQPKRIVSDTPRQNVKANLVQLANNYLQPFAPKIWRSSYMTVFMRGDCVGCFLVQIKNGKVWVHDPRNVRGAGELYHQLRMREALHWTVKALEAGWDINNVEFVVSTGDGLVTADHQHQYRLKPPERYPHPIFTAIYCNVSSNIPFPMTFGDLLRRAFAESSAMYRKGVDLAEWDEQMIAMMESPNQRTWDHKTNKAIFRGSIRASAFFREKFVAERKCNTSGRGALGILGDQYPDLLDIGLSGPCLSRIFRTPALSLERQQAFKYLIYAEGNSFWADRLPVMLFSTASVMKQQTPCGQFFEPLMKDGSEYIGVDYFFSNLVEKVQWAKDHDNETQRIAEASSKFAQDYLTSSGVADYVGAILSQYGKTLARRKVSIQRSALLYYPVMEGAKNL